MIKYENNNLPAIHQASISLLWYFNILELGDEKLTTTCMYLNKLARRSKEIDGSINEADFRGFGGKIALILQRCNAKVTSTS